MHSHLATVTVMNDWLHWLSCLETVCFVPLSGWNFIVCSKPECRNNSVGQAATGERTDRRRIGSGLLHPFLIADAGSQRHRFIALSYLASHLPPHAVMFSWTPSLNEELYFGWGRKCKLSFLTECEMIYYKVISGSIKRAKIICGSWYSNVFVWHMVLSTFNDSAVWQLC